MRVPAAAHNLLRGQYLNTSRRDEKPIPHLPGADCRARPGTDQSRSSAAGPMAAGFGTNQAPSTPRRRGIPPTDGRGTVLRRHRACAAAMKVLTCVLSPAGQPWGAIPHNRALVHRRAGGALVVQDRTTPRKHGCPQSSRARKSLARKAEIRVVHRSARGLATTTSLETRPLRRRQEPRASRSCSGGGRTSGLAGRARTSSMHETNTSNFFCLHKPVDRCGTTRGLSTRGAGRPELSRIRGHHATHPAHSPLPLASR